MARETGLRRADTDGEPPVKQVAPVDDHPEAIRAAEDAALRERLIAH
ncbi:MAG: hypothetical protein V3V97_20800 [Hyphomicrobiaceae bacterium]